jgi:CRISPR/Cas system endoribonuclease Cas6 (RAMP superfamily)
MGKVVYAAAEPLSPHTKKAMSTLADFSFYSGIGALTRLGFGQARRIRP